MREILFRAKRKDEKRKDNGEWLYGMPIETEYGLCIADKESLRHIDGAEWQFYDRYVDPETVGQFTELTDKNGVKIFGDDLRKDSEGRVFRIYDMPGGFAIKAHYWAVNCKDLVVGDELIMDHLTNAQTRQYIEQSTTHYGNIHDLSTSKND